jgi:tetratricopeptide (TPR) repeat protein
MPVKRNAAAVLDEARALYRAGRLAEAAALLAALARGLTAAGRHDEAAMAFARAIDLVPDDPALHQQHGSALLTLGRATQAEAAFRRALALDPGFATTYLEICQSRRMHAGDADLAAMEALQARARTLPAIHRQSLGFALGKAYDDIGDHDRAFAHLEAANRLKRRELRYDVARDEKLFRRIEAVFDDALMARLAGAGPGAATPVFIIGMPRAGTTLVEQILASHADVFGAGEIGACAEVVGVGHATNGRALIYPDHIAALGRDACHAYGTAYLQRLTERGANAARITDKMPTNFVYAGLIPLMLPGARIIHCLREPADTCLSLFMRSFTEGQHYSYDLGELGRFYSAYRRLMAHWRRVLPEGCMMEIRYEDVVRDLEGAARRLVAHCGLDWDARCIAFHDTARPVATASVSQVREPLYGRAVARWRRYAHHLGPLLAALGEEGP